MVKFKLLSKDSHSIYKEIFLYIVKLPIIFGAIATPFSIYFLVIGFMMKDTDFLINGFSSLAIVILMAMIIIVTSIRLKKNIIYYFKSNNVDGVIEYQIDLIDGTYIANNITSDTSFKFKKDDVKKTIILKHYIFMRFKTGTVFLFPKNEDICELFQINIQKKEK